MKKFLALMIVLMFVVMVTIPAYSEDTIDIVTRRIMTGSVNNGTMIGSSWDVWTPYLNGIKISETYFYRIAGDESSAITSRRRNITANSLFWSGLLAIAGGCTLMWTTDVEGIQVYSGLGISAVGIGCFFASIPFMGNTRPYPYAFRLAEAFNESH